MEARRTISRDQQPSNAQSETIAVHQPEKQGSSLNETDKLLIRIGAYTVGSALLLTGIYFGGRHIYRKYQQNHAAKQILTDDSAENIATRLNKALFDGWWANVDIVRQIFNQLPSQEVFQAIANKYGEVTKSSKSQIYLDLKKKLTEQEFFEMQNILAAKPAKNGQKIVYDMKWAIAMSKRIKSAFDYTWMGMDGTDKMALKQALLDIPTLRAFAYVMAAYKTLYKTDLTNALDSELDAFDFNWKDIVYTKPKN